MELRDICVGENYLYFGSDVLLVMLIDKHVDFINNLKFKEFIG